MDLVGATMDVMFALCCKDYKHVPAVVDLKKNTAEKPAVWSKHQNTPLS